ncbi:uncharacterized protein LOC135814392 [Sycon ciliatum]|uniref:uncharacterized protein LOC135814392 n=1 Tax=Sycon ciliatum TaxID=27933 RepID=UPI0031F69251
MAATSRFEFATATRIVFGSNTAEKELRSIVDSLGITRPIVVTGTAKRYMGVLKLLPAHEVFEVHGEPTVDVATAGTEQAVTKDCNGVIAIGGGSVLDVGKVIAALITNGGEPLDYMEVVGKGQKITKPSAPFVAVPTTAGTGAEVTRNGVLCSPEHRVKASIRAATMLPNVALVDPTLALSLPPAATASTGLDAFTQCLEPFISCLANPLTDAIAKEGLRHGAKSLLRAVRQGDDITAREGMALCSLFGGLALANAKLGAVHGFAGVLGGWCPGAPHGAICAVLLPHVIAVNADALKKRAPGSPLLARYDEVARIITERSNATCEDGVKWIIDLCTELDVPKLSTYGLKEEDIPTVVEKAAKSSSMKGNSLLLTTDELSDILRKAL